MVSIDGLGVNKLTSKITCYDNLGNTTRKLLLYAFVHVRDSRPPENLPGETEQIFIFLFAMRSFSASELFSHLKNQKKMSYKNVFTKIQRLVELAY